MSNGRKGRTIRMALSLGSLALGLFVGACALEGEDEIPFDDGEMVEQSADEATTTTYDCCTASRCTPATETSACGGVRLACNSVGCKTAGGFSVTHAQAQATAEYLFTSERDPEADVWDDPWGGGFSDPCLLWNEIYDDPCPVSGDGGGSNPGSDPGPGPSDPGGDWQCTKCNAKAMICITSCIFTLGPAAAPCIYGCIKKELECTHKYCE
jgi:hypothetical protein